VHRRALAHVSFGLEQADGFIVITGEIGAGKTTLIEHLLSNLDPATICIARIVTTQVSNDDVFRLAIAGFGVDISQPDKAANILAFQAALRSHAAQGRRCVLIVDEAQNLPLPALEELRMLSNLAAPGQIPLQTILLAQPEFRRKLATRPLDQLRQRVIASFHLDPLGEHEIAPYISHRLVLAGWAGQRLSPPL
jgi:type II secretory pathway predicted ATPase ExeA